MKLSILYKLKEMRSVSAVYRTRHVGRSTVRPVVYKSGSAKTYGSAMARPTVQGFRKLII